MAQGKPTPRQLLAARNTLRQAAEWAALDGRQRHDIGSVIAILNQIEDGDIKQHEEGTLP